MDLKERTRWIINHIVKRDKLSNPKIASLLGVKADTVNSYRAMLANPKVDFIIHFCDTFGIDLLWFTKGEGEPFPGAASQFPQVCSPSRYEISPAAPGPAAIVPLQNGGSGYLERSEKNTEINFTEKSLMKLCNLMGIAISRGWKITLSKILGITPAQLSNSISRNTLSKNLILNVEKKGYPAKQWLFRSETKLSPPGIPQHSNAELLKLAEGILCSGTNHAAALAMSILSMNVAVTAEKKDKLREQVLI